MSTFRSEKANDSGDWQNNKEMNPAANSAVTEEGVLTEDDQEKAQSWRPADVGDENVSEGSPVATQSSREHTRTGDPGRTPGKAEGVENPEAEGNE